MLVAFGNFQPIFPSANLDRAHKYSEWNQPTPMRVPRYRFPINRGINITATGPEMVTSNIDTVATNPENSRIVCCFGVMVES